MLFHGKFSQVTDYYHKQAEALQANFDTLLAMDQYVRGKEAIYAHLVPEKFKSLSMEEVDSMNVYNLLELYEKYGDVGHYSCETCHDLLALYVHVTDYDRFMLLNDYLLKMVKIGYLTPNKYAWAFDRPYHRKFDTSYYYFSVSPPISLATIETLTEAEQIEVNKRRRKIGLAPLPHLHEFITAHEL